MNLRKNRRAWVGIFVCLLLLGVTQMQSFATNTTGEAGTNSESASDESGNASSGSGASGETQDAVSDTGFSNAQIYENIRNKQEEISQINEEREALESGLSNLQRIKEELESEKSSLKQYVTDLDNSLVGIEENIADLESKIAEKEYEIQQTQAELDAALMRQEKQKTAMYIRIRLMYENGDSYITEMLLRSASFSDFLNSADYIEKVMEYDQRMLEEFQQNAQLIALCEEELEIEKIFLDQAKENVEKEQNAIEELIAQKSRDLIAYESDISNKEQAIKEYEAAIAKQDAEIEALEAAIAEEKKRMLENSETVLTYDGGMFKFPLASYTRVSDDYGMRMHPTLGVEKFHSGIDLAAPAGTAIYAAYDGKVVAAAYSDSMGNYVMIDHGDELYTIYMHASALYVSKGDVVVKGETIAAVGTTGRSTGNHLHFGVRKNGAYVSPWSYLSM